MSFVKEKKAQTHSPEKNQIHYHLTAEEEDGEIEEDRYGVHRLHERRSSPEHSPTITRETVCFRLLR